MYVEADRISIAMNDKLDDVSWGGGPESGQSTRPSEQDPVGKILEKSKKLTERHAKFTKKQEIHQR